MGLFFTSNKDKLSRLDIKHALNNIGILSGEDKKAIMKRLRQRSGGGITERDVIEVAREFKQDSSDSVDGAEADAAKRELLQKLTDKEE
ncbi:MAG: hypothetical protein A3E37_02120 [Candidatus Andersenbacteria bacterium RIFCSPHIGHO2_12_FULL_46_9]|nr:MAG: hypothetical protein UW94_C0011G0007 [Parcubacteria group bacterium GW2011_GWA2_45_14]OGY34552.1 MAG: hypothetical protein A3B76_06185 [Candidatus Andersenbacteria bacterium RIFCSPHIGHO2_02_FULL_46_16]OGY36113.1 MAG: hypothetical protein A3E37_02120 [Candidatus Andersenbacteria bacterium RIFCSPHIGHO2_12_FULL_46_9]OGY38053.1 MAG: hypothetical protein A3I08_04710 [Candidatus Andersenbacteria bacterium RIFCSPLOWO2_02_FULL_46_11]OGY39879.1 MAG: hypothetical protein A3G57_02370 [Candidatus A